VGRILRESGSPTFELRASIIIGSGSLSFEMVRALVEKLPVMVTPRWVQRTCWNLQSSQPPRPAPTRLGDQTSWPIAISS
jgi:hypothetical protein